MQPSCQNLVSKHKALELISEFKTSLGYVRPCLKNNYKRGLSSWSRTEKLSLAGVGSSALLHFLFGRFRWCWGLNCTGGHSFSPTHLVKSCGRAVSALTAAPSLQPSCLYFLR